MYQIGLWSAGLLPQPELLSIYPLCWRKTKAPERPCCTIKEQKDFVPPILPGPFFFITSNHSLICHLQDFWFIFQGHSGLKHDFVAPASLHCPNVLGKPQDLWTALHFLQTGNPPSFPKLNKAIAEHPNNTALVPQTNWAPSINLVKQLLLPGLWAGLMLNSRFRNT